MLDAGEIMEFNDPYILLRNPEGQFSKFVKQTGKRMSAQLHAAAKDVYFNRIQNRNMHDE